MRSPKTKASSIPGAACGVDAAANLGRAGLSVVEDASYTDARWGSQVCPRIAPDRHVIERRLLDTAIMPIPDRADQTAVESVGRAGKSTSSDGRTNVTEQPIVPAHFGGVGSCTSAANVVALQRSAGNRAVAGVLGRPARPSIQRSWTNPLITLKSDATLIKEALDDGNVESLRHVDEVTGVSLTDTLKLIDLLNAKGDSWGRDKSVMIKLWTSIGADTVLVANKDGGARWKASVAKIPALTESVPEVAKLRDRFPKDVLALANQTLESNHQLVLDQMKQLGISTDPKITGAQQTADQEDRLKDLQAAAGAVARLQAAQEHARTLNVGWEKSDSGPQVTPGSASDPGSWQPSAPSDACFLPVTYDPLTKPMLTEAPPDTLLMPVYGKGTVVPYAEVDAKYKATAMWMEFFLGRFPELYAVTREGKSQSTADFAKKDSRAALDQLGAGMHKLLGDIEAATLKLGHQVDVLDLIPLHGRMTNDGVKAPGSDVAWNQPVQTGVAKQLVADHNFNRAMAALAIDVAANALFLVAPLTGGGALLVMLAGVGLLAGKAAMSADRAAALAQTASTAAAPGSALVNDETVDAAQKEAEADKAAVALAIIMAVGDAAISSAVQSGGRVAELEAKLSQRLTDPLVSEGAHTSGYIDATGPRVRSPERDTIQMLGEEYGCHSCGAKDAGPYGTWHGDHQPPTGLVTRGIKTGQQILVPHCESCSNRQGQVVREIIEIWNELQIAKVPGIPSTVAPIVVPPKGDNK
jgi:hypothetical protein